MNRAHRICCLLIAGIGLYLNAYSQGIPAQAFKNITLHKADGSVIKNAAIVWRNGAIESAGKNVTVPFDAEVWDGGDSLHVYPGFIDGNAYWGSPARKRFQDTPQHRGQPGYERAGIRPERHARETLESNSGDFKKAMETGFTTAALGINGYMIPGQLDLYFLQPELNTENMFQSGLAMQMQFERSFRVYPSTVMGIMARLEQLTLDAQNLKDWKMYYASNTNQVAPPQTDPVLEALWPVMEKKQRVFFKVDSKEMIQRVFRLQDKLGFDVVLVSGMEAYKVADELKRRNIPVLASINFPDQPAWKTDKKGKDKEDVTDTMQAFRDKQWQAYLKRYKNIHELMQAGVQVGYASADLDLKDFSKKFKNWRKYGEIADNDILKIMTVNTAAILDKSHSLGDLEKGQVASFSIMNKPFTEEKTKILYSVSAGNLNDLND